MQDNLLKLEEDIDYISLIVSRRFDTDYDTGKGYYEAVAIDPYKKVVLIASEDEIETYPGYEKEYCVKNLGERATTVTKSNAYRSYEVTEYYTYYITVEDSKNPSKTKEKLSEIRNITEELEKEFLERSKDNNKESIQYIKKNIEQIIDIM